MINCICFEKVVDSEHAPPELKVSGTIAFYSVVQIHNLKRKLFVLQRRGFSCTIGHFGVSCAEQYYVQGGTMGPRLVGCWLLACRSRDGAANTQVRGGGHLPRALPPWPLPRWRGGGDPHTGLSPPRRPRGRVAMNHLSK